MRITTNFNSFSLSHNHLAKQKTDFRIFCSLSCSAPQALCQTDQSPSLDITLDGTNEVDSNLNVRKGDDACDLREKVLAEAAATFFCSIC
ncbi:uncharacterized protein MELLADRAFT_88897 [Melampsora larici-populina 98AG31]|uniref:Ribose-5-phosphate isomerase n=1 Tax=Melampsora larici-populina (strain 98AG31 / pathotype 3-4-7) TaxID=747676 RepID=F4R670_MELLP|nr:uncharacterized protein MELLADRAFT_88897 [Melampsora larici-populina 98AG31]EGG12519.1 hypothetical protein MELLADRAFT_88897 [Melampsora larici-populina 98AG31]